MSYTRSFHGWSTDPENVLGTLCIPSLMSGQTVLDHCRLGTAKATHQHSQTGPDGLVVRRFSVPQSIISLWHALPEIASALGSML